MSTRFSGRRAPWLGIVLCLALAGCSYGSGGPFEYGGAIMVREGTHGEPAEQPWHLDVGGRWFTSGLGGTGDSAWARFIDGRGTAITVRVEDEHAELAVGDVTIALDEGNGCDVIARYLEDSAASGEIACDSGTDAIGSFAFRWAASWLYPLGWDQVTGWPSAIPAERALSPESWEPRE